MRVIRTALHDKSLVQVSRALRVELPRRVRIIYGNVVRHVVREFYHLVEVGACLLLLAHEKAHISLGEGVLHPVVAQLDERLVSTESLIVLARLFVRVRLIFEYIDLEGTHLHVDGVDRLREIRHGIRPELLIESHDAEPSVGELVLTADDQGAVEIILRLFVIGCLDAVHTQVHIVECLSVIGGHRLCQKLLSL